MQLQLLQNTGAPTILEGPVSIVESLETPRHADLFAQSDTDHCAQHIAPGHAACFGITDVGVPVKKP